MQTLEQLHLFPNLPVPKVTKTINSPEQSPATAKLSEMASPRMLSINSNQSQKSSFKILSKVGRVTWESEQNRKTSLFTRMKKAWVFRLSRSRWWEKSL